MLLIVLKNKKNEIVKVHILPEYSDVCVKPRRAHGCVVS